MSSSVHSSVSYSLIQKLYVLLSDKCCSLILRDNSYIPESKAGLGLILIGLFPAVKLPFQIVRSAKLKRSTVFQKKWELQYFALQINSNTICLICKQTSCVCKDYSIKCHYNIRKEKYDLQGKLKKIN
jgi:hypothetical protein